MPLYKYNGKRIRASDRSLVARSFSSRLVLLFLAALLLLNINTLLHIDWDTVSLLHDGSFQLTVTPYMIVSVISSVSGVSGCCLFVSPLPVRQNKAALSPTKAGSHDTGKWLV